MFRLLSKRYLWAGFYSFFLIVCTVFVLLDTFVIPKTGQVVETSTATTSNTSATTNNTSNSEPEITATSYKDENINITITTSRANDTTYYVADIIVSDPAYLKTAFAENSYGRNIKAKTSTMAESNNAILAINGDYYGFRDGGFVIRNGVLYRETVRSDTTEDLVIDSNGDFSIVNEGDTSAAALAEAGAQQVLSFGPALVVDGQIVVDSGDEVDQSKTSNPRTAIGQIGANHYVMVVSDGRTDESTGLSLLQLAEVMSDLGCQVAYNLDGGGSSTMWFNGSIVNKPTSNGAISEREISDIIYVGY